MFLECGDNDKVTTSEADAGVEVSVFGIIWHLKFLQDIYMGIYRRLLETLMWTSEKGERNRLGSHHM